MNVLIRLRSDYLLHFLYFFNKYSKNGKHLDRQIKILLHWSPGPCIISGMPKNGIEADITLATLANVRLDRHRFHHRILDHKLVPFRIPHPLGLLSHVVRVLSHCGRPGFQPQGPFIADPQSPRLCVALFYLRAGLVAFRNH